MGRRKRFFNKYLQNWWKYSQPNFNLFVLKTQLCEGPFLSVQHNKLEKINGNFFINGTQTNSCTFKYNYYWMMGDTGRTARTAAFGDLCPKHIVGKPSLVWFSSSNNWKIHRGRLFININ